MAPETKHPVQKTAAKKKSAAKDPSPERAAPAATAAKPARRRSVTLPPSGKDPKGGLTAVGRKVYNDATGGHLKAGVQGKADTPEKMVRKGSFLRRHFANPPGPVVDKDGQPTRQALQAAAWGEPVPKSEADEKKLAEKGSKLLEQYHQAKGDGAKPSNNTSRRPAKRAPKKS